MCGGSERRERRGQITKNYSKSCSRYSIRNGKWTEISECSVGLEKPTLCSFGDRFIFKMGGLNEFDYISKAIELYDTIANTWTLVKVSGSNILEEVRILEDSSAIQVSGK